MKVQDLFYVHTTPVRTDKAGKIVGGGESREFRGKAALDAAPAEQYKEWMKDAELRADIDSMEQAHYGRTRGFGPQDPSARGANPVGEFMDGPTETPLVDQVPTSEVAQVPLVDQTPTGAEFGAVEPTPAVAPPTVPAAPVVQAPVEKWYEYQPTDENGRPIGGLQRFKYSTMEELADKLRDANVHVLRLVRKTREEAALKDVTAPEGTTKFAEPEYMDVLTDETRAKLAEAAKGGDADARRELELDNMARKVNQQTNDSIETQISLATAQFKSSNYGYYQCPENAAKIMAWMRVRNLDLRDPRNYQKAYDVLNGINALIAFPSNQPTPITAEAPTVREETPVAAAAPVAAPATVTPANTQPVPTTPARISSEEAVQPTRTIAQVPTGLTRDQGTPVAERPIRQPEFYVDQLVKSRDGKSIVEKIRHTGPAALGHMTSEQYRKLLEADIAQERRTGTGTGFRQWVQRNEKTPKYARGGGIDPNDRG